MCPNYSYNIEVVTPNHQWRGVAFLVSADPKVTAKSIFDRFAKTNKNIERAFGAKFDSWQSRIINDKWYHGWNKSAFGGKYVRCFVFKHRKDKDFHRFYGFLCHPKMNNPRFELCVLVVYANKKDYETDEPDLAETEKMREMPDIQNAIMNYFKETP